MGIRELGAPGGNPLAKNKAWQPSASTYTRIVSGSGTLLPPQGAKFMRVAVIGGGATASLPTSGGGGGCAATKVIPASPINYVIGAAGQSSNATFQGYSLVGGSGAVPAGGTGAGGDYNFSGGNGGTSTSSYYRAGGGGGAGPSGNGGDGAIGISNTDGNSASGTPGALSSSGWGIGGGAGGSQLLTNTSIREASGGGGSGAASGSASNQSTSGVGSQGGFSTPIWGKPSSSCFNATSPSLDGGEMGGGGACISGPFNGIGGSGGMVVEWFY